MDSLVKSKCSYSVQCAAVKIQRSEMIEAPQRCDEKYCKDTCHGFSSIVVSYPPTIRSSCSLTRGNGLAETEPIQRIEAIFFCFCHLNHFHLNILWMLECLRSATLWAYSCWIQLLTSCFGRIRNKLTMQMAMSLSQLKLNAPPTMSAFIIWAQVRNTS